MSINRPVALSIAGFDPSGGAGILADIKTFEQHKVLGLGVCSALTRQNDSHFFGINWLSLTDIIAQAEPLIDKFAISAVKVGIVNELNTAKELILYIKNRIKTVHIVLDPVIKASAGFDFHKSIAPETLKFLLGECTVLTPNYDELLLLEGVLGDKLYHYGDVLIKGGHSPVIRGTDTLYESGSPTLIEAISASVWDKHGSGCVLSSAIASNLAYGHNLAVSCRLAKAYTEKFLNSNSSLLGYHNL